MRKTVAVAVMAMVIASCGGDTTSTTDPSGESPDTNGGETSSGSAEFALTQVGLGDQSMVVITNVGDGPGNLEGHALCQRPAYYGFPSVELAPGESVAVATSDAEVTPPDGVTLLDEVATIGALDPVSGEVGLYSERSFGDPDAILSYVEWGSAGHGRSGTAVDAGIWTEDGFVETSSDTTTLTADTTPPITPGEWSTS